MTASCQCTESCKPVCADDKAAEPDHRDGEGKTGGCGGGEEKGGAGGCCGRNDRQHHRNGCLGSRHRNDLEYDRKYRFDRDGYLDFGQQYLRQLFHRSDGRRTKSVLHDRSQRQ